MLTDHTMIKSTVIINNKAVSRSPTFGLRSTHRHFEIINQFEFDSMNVSSQVIRPAGTARSIAVLKRRPEPERKGLGLSGGITQNELLNCSNLQSVVF